MAMPAENVVAFYKKGGRCEQWIKGGNGAIRWTRLSCRLFAAIAVRPHAPTISAISRILATPEQINDWSLTSLKEKLIKIGAWSATAAISRSRWLKSPFREPSSPTS